MLVLKNSTEYFARRESGGKGYNLYLISQHGIEVPDWVILGRSVYEDCIEESGLKNDLIKLTKAYSEKSISAKDLSRKVNRLFVKTQLSKSVLNLIDDAYRVLGDNEMISVRSSAVALRPGDQ